MRRLLYFGYRKLLEREVRNNDLPVHIGLILDGNRRYAKEMGFDDVTMGHKEGAKKLDDMLTWCVEFGIKIITIWVLSTDNTQRDEDEVAALLKVIEEKINRPFKKPHHQKKWHSDQSTR